jgi:hypothetical protein
MMVLCRRDTSGFLNELYYRCLSCGLIPEESSYRPGAKTVRKKPQTPTGFRSHSSYFWNAAAATVLAALVLTATMQIPVPVTVFATDTSLDPVKDILPYIRVLNFTVTKFSLNYSEDQMSLRLTADSATVKSTETAQNVTTSVIVINKVLVNYTDTKRKVLMGFAYLTVTITIRYEELLAHIDATAILPVWTTIINRLTG